jgi:sulfoxide reductase heme-binding subunit YedZ
MKRALVTAVTAGGLLGLLLWSIPLGHVAWYVSRAAGLAAFLALTGSVVFGLLLSSRSGPRRLPKAAVFELHQFLAVLGLCLVAIHAAALLFDRAVQFGVADILMPFGAPYRPAWVAAGVVSAWLSAAIAASFWVKKSIGQRAWRGLHFGSFLAYGLAVAHGLGAGSDSDVPAVYWLYLGSTALVVSLTTFRVLSTRAGRSRERARKAARAVAPRAPAGASSPS